MGDISNSTLYNKKSAIDHVNALAFGRKAGTTEEYIAMDYIRDSLNQKYMKTELDPFLWVSIWGLYILLFVILILIMLFVIFLSIFIIAGRAFGYITLFVSIYFLVYYFLSVSIYKNFDLTNPVQRGHISHNVTTKIQANVYRKRKPVIIFCAHYDSVSINYSERIINSVIIFFILYVFIFFPLNLTMDTQFIFKLINIILLIGFLIFFISIRAKNKSIGSVDNASGTAILIELSKLFHNYPLNNIDLIFLWTGAEEMGLYGSKAFCYRNFKNLDKEYDLDKSYVINVDMVGSYIGL
ncbi:MAG: M28 family peptidase, partial [Candidatus Odinarchaeota archaeon]